MVFALFIKYNDGEVESLLSTIIKSLIEIMKYFLLGLLLAGVLSIGVTVYSQAYPPSLSGSLSILEQLAVKLAAQSDEINPDTPYNVTVVSPASPAPAPGNPNHVEGRLRVTGPIVGDASISAAGDLHVAGKAIISGGISSGPGGDLNAESVKTKLLCVGPDADNEHCTTGGDYQGTWCGLFSSSIQLGIPGAFPCNGQQVGLNYCPPGYKFAVIMHDFAIPIPGIIATCLKT